GPVVEVPCLGHCELAPVHTVGDRIVPEPVYRTNAGYLGLDAADESLADYERRGGLELLRELPPADRVVAALKESGLAGYGGAGPPRARDRRVPHRRAPRGAVPGRGRRGRCIHLRRGDGDARVDGGPPRDAAAEAAVSVAVRLPRPADADPERRDARAHPGDP